jgi:TldD protein
MAVAGAAASTAHLRIPAVTAQRSVACHSRLDPTIIIDSTDVRALAMRALDAAKSAGATYADVRLTRRLTQSLSASTFGGENELVGVGVRVRVQGGWGFAGSPYWTPDEMVRLAAEAAAEAKANAPLSPAWIEWAPIPVASGAWATPIEVDPFVLPIEEKMDHLQMWVALATRFRACGGEAWARFSRIERVVATTEGTYCTQTLYTTSGVYRFDRRPTKLGDTRASNAYATGLENTAAGWEIFTQADIPTQLPRLYAKADPRVPDLAVKPGNIGRYTVVFDAGTMGSLLEETIGKGAQVDRALGYEANAGGTSFLGPHPLALLGRYQVTAPLMTVTANRSMHRGVGTVKWDDEGVEPDAFTLVKDGVLVDYQTTREQATWLTPWYQMRGVPARSHGCAGATDALDITMQHPPNLVLEPAKQDITFDELVASISKGLAVMNGSVLTDFQQRTGKGNGTIREIVNGKLGSVVTGLNFFFNTTKILKNVTALGGPRSVLQYASGDSKGQPAQGTPYSVRAVPAQIENVDFLDPKRKA